MLFKSEEKRAWYPPEEKSGIAAEVDRWLVACQAVVDKGDAHCPANGAKLTIMEGSRYLRIVRTEDRGFGKTGSYVWAFIDKTNGDVLRPHGWKAPARNKKTYGNLYDSTGGMSHVRAYGVR
jgi:hypothetical protein